MRISFNPLVWLSLFLGGSSALSPMVWADVDPSATPVLTHKVAVTGKSLQEAAQPPLAGHYQILVWDKDYLADIKLDEEKNIFLLWQPGHEETPLSVYISNRAQADYRPWWHGEIELVAPLPRPAGKWSDRVQTQAPFIEYRSGQKLILHLQKRAGTIE